MGRRAFWGQPEPDQPEPDPLPRADEQAAILMRGLNRFMRSVALDAQLDEYLATRGPRPDEETDDPALDQH